MMIRREPAIREALSLDEQKTESEYLRRELGLDWAAVTTDDLLARVGSRCAEGRSTVVIVSTAPKYVGAFSALPQGSLILVLLSDEAYTPTALELARSPAVRLVLRNYSLSLVGWAAWLGGVRRFLSETKKVGLPVQEATRLSVGGAAVRRRIDDWRRVSARVVEFPLGYTAPFAQAFIRMRGLDGQPGSLLAAGQIPSAARDTSVVFRGQPGQLQRKLGLALASRLAQSSIMTTAGWGGVQADEATSYVHALSTSRYGLCPPGGVSNESFRILESVMCGAVPIRLDYCVSQGTINETDWQASISGRTWSEALDRADKGSESVRDRVIKSASAAYLSRLAEVSALLAREDA